MNLETWFPTPVFYSFASDDLVSEIKNEYFAAEQDILNSLESNVWGDNVSATYNSNNDVLNNYSLLKLKTFILDVANHFNSMLYKDAKCFSGIDSWVNYNKRYQYQDRHCHFSGRKNEMSGVYYIQTNGKDGNLRMHPPSPLMPVHSKGSKGLIQEYVEYAPEEGKIILFPSWVEHSVKPNMTDSTRISVAFNLK